VSRYQEGKTNLDFTEARDIEWQWHQLGHMQVFTSYQTDNHASTPPISFLQAGCPSCRPTNGVKALKAISEATIATAVPTTTSLHFIYQEVQIHAVKNTNAMCTICNLQQSGRVQQGTKYTNNCPV